MAEKNHFIEELEAMRKRMEDLFMRNFAPDQTETSAQAEAEPEEAPGGWAPAADVIESETEIIYLLDLPGVLDQDLQVECRADTLLVYGARREALPDGDPLEAERPRGPFSRTFKLPCPIRQDAISAEYRKGVLRIVVPRECSTGGRAQKVSVRREE